MIQKCIHSFIDFDSLSPDEQFCSKGREVIFGYELCESAIFAGKYGIPLLPAYKASIPESFITYSDVRRNSDRSCGIAGFESDRALMRLVRNLKKRIPILSQFHCVSEPDFSVKIGLPRAIQIYSTFLSNAVAYNFVTSGLSVLPSVSWGDKTTYDFCFDGHSQGGAFLVSTIGVLKDERTRFFFRNGFQEFLRRLQPEAVILYGDTNDELLSWMPTQVDIHFASHNRFSRARHYGR